LSVSNIDRAVHQFEITKSYVNQIYNLKNNLLDNLLDNAYVLIMFYYNMLHMIELCCEINSCDVI